MSRRNTYLIGGAAVVIGIVLIVIALSAMSGDDGGGPTTTAVEGPSAGQAEQPAPGGQGESSGERSQGSALSRQLDQRRAVRAPGFELEVLDKGSAPAQGGARLEQAVAGDSLVLTKLRGTPVVLHVWSSECGPCRSDARLIDTMWRRWGRRGVAFLGVSVDEPAEDALRFAREYDLTYPILRDEGGRVARAYGVTSLPETFFISSSGDVIGHVAGSPSVGQIERGAAAARAGRTFGSEQGGSREPRG